MSTVVIPEMVTAVVGAPTDIQYTLIYWPDAYDTIIALGLDGGVISMNLPLLVPQVEGVDFPFFQRWEYEEEPRLFETDWTPWEAAEWQEPGPGLLATPPSTEPLFNLAADQTHETVLLQWADQLEAYRLRIDADYVSLFPAPLGQITYDDTVCRMLSEIQRHLLEPVIDEGVSWQLWTEDEVRGSMEERIASFLLATGVTRERITIDVAAGTLEVQIPQTVIEIRRVQWFDGVNRQTLCRDDEDQLDSANSGWESDAPSIPAFYVEQPLPTLTLKLNPVPATDGELHLVVVHRPVSLSGCSNFPIPSMFIPGIKWGVLADLLRKEGEANDPERAAYCEKRFAEVIDLARSLLGVAD